MTNWNVPEKKTTRRILLAACSTALAMALTVSLPQTTHAKHVTPPPVPSDIQVPEGNKAFLEGHAVGTQNYICLPCPNATTPAAMCPDASGFAWILFTPQATLFNDRARQVTTHFFSPNPVETGTVRPTWQHSRDTSTVWGGRAVSSSDPDFVAPDAIPWLLIPLAGAEEGATGGDILTATTFITATRPLQAEQRLPVRDVGHSVGRRGDDVHADRVHGGAELGEQHRLQAARRDL